MKLIEKAVAVNLHTEGAVTFPIALHLEVLYKIRWLQRPYLNRITELQKAVSTYISQNDVWDNFTALPPSGEKQIRK